MAKAMSIKEAATKCSAKRSYIDLTEYATGTENWKTMNYDSFQHCMRLELLKSRLGEGDYKLIYDEGYKKGFDYAVELTSGRPSFW